MRVFPLKNTDGGFFMRILAVDYGEVRTGLAVCDRTEFLASPVGVIEERKFEEL